MRHYEHLQRENEVQIKAFSFVTWVGLWVNVVVCVLKITAGFMGNSRAVVADGVHSFSDLITDVAVLVGVRFWVAPADSCHPYGHQRLESLISLVIGVVLAMAGVGIAFDALNRIGVEHTESVGSMLALVVTLLGMLSKEVLYRWTLKRGRDLKSSAVEANAWDHRSDAISSIPTALAVAIAMWFPAWSVVDLLAAILVSVFILHAAWKICLPAVQTLLDRGADAGVQEKIIAFAKTIEGIEDVHALRTRYLGTALGVDMHAAVKGSLTVAEGNIIAHTLEEALYSAEAEAVIGIKIYDALVHIDPIEIVRAPSQE